MNKASELEERVAWLELLVKLIAPRVIGTPTVKPLEDTSPETLRRYKKWIEPEPEKSQETT